MRWSSSVVSQRPGLIRAEIREPADPRGLYNGGAVAETEPFCGTGRPEGVGRYGLVPDRADRVLQDVQRPVSAIGQRNRSNGGAW